jgi:hypothetical protein
MAWRAKFQCISLGIAIPLALSAGSPTIAMDAPEPPLKLDGAWTMDYADNACHLVASFGKAKDRVTVRFTRLAPQDSIRIMLAAPRFAGIRDVQSSARMAFLPIGEPHEPFMVSNGTSKISGEAMPTVFASALRVDNRSPILEGISDLPPVSLETEKAVNGLAVKVGGTREFVLNLVSMGPPLAAMRQCTDDLVRSWGFDPGEIATRQNRAKPVGNVGQWIGPNSYPRDMLEQGASAIVSFRLAVDETGAVTDCFVLEMTSPATIGPYTCGLIAKNARLTPSLDKDGVPVKDFYINRVVWRVAEG